jgi:hypothetical protein
MRLAKWRCMKDSSDDIGHRSVRQAVGWVTGNGKDIPATAQVDVTSGCTVGALQLVMETPPAEWSRLRSGLRSGKVEVFPVSPGPSAPQAGSMVTFRHVSHRSWFYMTDHLTNAGFNHFSWHRSRRRPAFINWSSDACTKSPDAHDMGWRNLKAMDRHYGTRSNDWNRINKGVADRRLELDLQRACDRQNGSWLCYSAAYMYAEMVCGWGWDVCNVNRLHYKWT